MITHDQRLFIAPPHRMQAREVWWQKTIRSQECGDPALRRGGSIYWPRPAISSSNADSIRPGWPKSPVHPASRWGRSIGTLPTRRRSLPPSAKPTLLNGSRKRRWRRRSEEHTSELQSLMRISYAVFCLKQKTNIKNGHQYLSQTKTATN